MKWTIFQHLTLNAALGRAQTEIAPPAAYASEREKAVRDISAGRFITIKATRAPLEITQIEQLKAVDLELETSKTDGVQP